VLTDVAFRQLVQEQVAAADVALLRSGEDRDDEVVADVDVELVPRTAARISAAGFPADAMGSWMLFPGGPRTGSCRASCQ
jgi:hypothetical protein